MIMSDDDFKWWQSLCLVDNVAPTPEAVKQWLLDVNEYREKELQDQLAAAAQKTIEAMKGREGRLREALNHTRKRILPSIFGTPEDEAREWSRVVTAALAESDGGA